MSKLVSVAMAALCLSGAASSAPAQEVRYPSSMTAKALLDKSSRMTPIQWQLTGKPQLLKVQLLPGFYCVAKSSTGIGKWNGPTLPITQTGALQECVANSAPGDVCVITSCIVV